MKKWFYNIAWVDLNCNVHWLRYKIKQKIRNFAAVTEKLTTCCQTSLISLRASFLVSNLLLERTAHNLLNKQTRQFAPSLSADSWTESSFSISYSSWTIPWGRHLYYTLKVRTLSLYVLLSENVTLTLCSSEWYLRSFRFSATLHSF